MFSTLFLFPGGQQKTKALLSVSCSKRPSTAEHRNYTSKARVWKTRERYALLACDVRLGVVEVPWNKS